MILSNKKLRLIIITLLLLIFCFFLGLLKPKAATYTEYINYPVNPRFFELNPNIKSTQIPITGADGNTYSPFVNAGDGTIVFSLYYECTSSPCDPIIEVNVLSGGLLYACEYSNPVWYRDNTTQYMVITPTCNVAFNNNRGLSGVEVRRNGGSGKVYGRTGTVATLITREGTTVNVNQQDVVNAVNNSQQQTIQQIENSSSIAHQDAQAIKDTITNDNIDNNNASSSASTWNSKNTSNGTVTQLLTLPITLLQAIVNGLQTSCSSFSLGTLFNTEIILPCINVSSLIGSGLFTSIDLLFSGFMILSIGKKLIKIFNDFTNLKSNQIDELYGGGTK